MMDRKIEWRFDCEMFLSTTYVVRAIWIEHGDCDPLANYSGRYRKLHPFILFSSLFYSVEKIVSFSYGNRAIFEIFYTHD